MEELPPGMAGMWLTALTASSHKLESEQCH